ncbi:hypothetical protein [Yoonia maritima]|uniref:hypothetical protein n=1 Tax=Yoonia maritima TaxID=1435347 RepID=UPI003735D69E
MTSFFFMPETTASTQTGTEPTMKDVTAHLEEHGLDYLLKALRTLQSHMNNAPLSTLPANSLWVNAEFPKPKSGRHPRPDLPQAIRPYAKWRADLLRAVSLFDGSHAEKKAMKSQIDEWQELRDAASKLAEKHPAIHAGRLSQIDRLAEHARRQGLLPIHLDNHGYIQKLAANSGQDCRSQIRNAQKLLNDLSNYPDIRRHLPADRILVLPTRKMEQKLPSDIEAFLEGLVKGATVRIDPVSNLPLMDQSDNTVSVYYAAMRHHIRALQKLADDSYERITDLHQINDLHSLFSRDRVFATIRHTESRVDQEGGLKAGTASSYYQTIAFILERNGLDDGSLARTLKHSEFIRSGVDERKGMRPEKEDWCKALVTDERKTRTFLRLHLIFMEMALETISGRRLHQLTRMELERVRQLGYCAAIAAIELAGRPVRRSNAVSFQYRGKNANFFVPSQKTGRNDYSFKLSAQQTKARKDDPLTIIRKEMKGPRVLDWYLKTIRPLCRHHEDSVFLFPQVKKGSDHIGELTFTKWFQKYASEAGLPMTFHMFRHGVASLLVNQDWSNIAAAAELLGNSVRVCEERYAFFNEEKLVSSGQQKLIENSKVGHK